jgi:hypothetical protein
MFLSKDVFSFQKTFCLFKPSLPFTFKNNKKIFYFQKTYTCYTVRLIRIRITKFIIAIARQTRLKVDVFT